MKNIIKKIISACALVMLCAACEVNAGSENNHPTAAGKLLFDAVSTQINMGSIMVRTALLFNQYYILESEPERLEFKLKYFHDREIAQSPQGWYIIYNQQIEWQITMAKDLTLDEPEAIWTIYAGPHVFAEYYSSWGENSSQAILSPTNVAGEYSCGVRTMLNRQLRSATLKVKFNIESETLPTSFSIMGSGERSMDDSVTTVKFNVLSPLVCNFGQRNPQEGTLQIEASSPNKDGVERAEAQYVPYERVRIVYNSMEEVWDFFYNPLWPNRNPM